MSTTQNNIPSSSSSSSEEDGHHRQQVQESTPPLQLSSSSVMTISCEEENCKACDSDIDALPGFLNEYGASHQNCLVCFEKLPLDFSPPSFDTVKVLKEICIKSILPDVQVQDGVLDQSYPFCEGCSTTKISPLTDLYRQLVVLQESFDDARFTIVAPIISAFVIENGDQNSQSSTPTHKRDSGKLFRYWKRYLTYPTSRKIRMVDPQQQQQQPPQPKDKPPVVRKKKKKVATANQSTSSWDMVIPLPIPTSSTSGDESQEELRIKEEPLDADSPLGDYSFNQNELLPVLHLEDLNLQQTDNGTVAALAANNSSDSDTACSSQDPIPALNFSHPPTNYSSTSTSSDSEPETLNPTKWTKPPKNPLFPLDTINEGQQLPVIYTDNSKKRAITRKLLLKNGRNKNKMQRLSIIRQLSQSSDSSSSDSGGSGRNSSSFALKCKRKAIRTLVRDPRSAVNDGNRVRLITSHSHKHGPGPGPGNKRRRIEIQQASISPPLSQSSMISVKAEAVLCATSGSDQDQEPGYHDSGLNFSEQIPLTSSSIATAKKAPLVTRKSGRTAKNGGKKLQKSRQRDRKRGNSGRGRGRPRIPPDLRKPTKKPSGRPRGRPRTTDDSSGSGSGEDLDQLLKCTPNIIEGSGGVGVEVKVEGDLEDGSSRRRRSSRRGGSPDGGFTDEDEDDSNYFEVAPPPTFYPSEDEEEEPEQGRQKNRKRVEEDQNEDSEYEHESDYIRRKFATDSPPQKKRKLPSRKSKSRPISTFTPTSVQKKRNSRSTRNSRGSRGGGRTNPTTSSTRGGRNSRNNRSRNSTSGRRKSKKAVNLHHVEDPAGAEDITHEYEEDEEAFLEQEEEEMNAPHEDEDSSDDYAIGAELPAVSGRRKGGGKKAIKSEPKHGELSSSGGENGKKAGRGRPRKYPESGQQQKPAKTTEKWRTRAKKQPKSATPFSFGLPIVNEDVVDLSNPGQVSAFSSLLTRDVCSLVRSVDPPSSPSPTSRSRKSRPVSYAPIKHDDDDDAVANEQAESDADARIDDADGESSEGSNRPSRSRVRKRRASTTTTTENANDPDRSTSSTTKKRFRRPTFGPRKDPKRPRSKTQRMCSLCGKILVSDWNLTVHMRTHNLPLAKPYPCTVEGCGKRFHKPEHLSTHTRTHTGERPYICEICSCRFSYRVVLRTHKAAKHGIYDSEGVWECACGAKTVAETFLRKHFRSCERRRGLNGGKGMEDSAQFGPALPRLTAGDEYRVWCNYCEIQFEDGESFRLHSTLDEKHVEIKKAKIAEARKELPEYHKAWEQKHQQQQKKISGSGGEIAGEGGAAGENDVAAGTPLFEPDPIRTIFTCHICGEDQIDGRLLQIHIKRMHLSRGQATCEFCGKSFSTPGNLKTHLIIHSENKPFVCGAANCGEKFNSKQGLKNHAEKAHSATHFCPYCDKEIRKERALLRHMVTIHRELHCKDKPHVCPSCYRNFGGEDELAAHLSAEHKDVTCMTCGKVFGYRYDLNRHMKRDHNPSDPMPPRKEGQGEEADEENGGGSGDEEDGEEFRRPPPVAAVISFSPKKPRGRPRLNKTAPQTATQPEQQDHQGGANIMAMRQLDPRSHHDFSQFLTDSRQLTSSGGGVPLILPLPLVSANFDQEYAAMSQQQQDAQIQNPLQHHFPHNFMYH